MARYSGLNWSPLRVSTAIGSIGEAGFFQEEGDLGRVGRSVEVKFEHHENSAAPVLVLNGRDWLSLACGSLSASDSTRRRNRKEIRGMSFRRESARLLKQEVFTLPCFNKRQ